MHLFRLVRPPDGKSSLWKKVQKPLPRFEQNGSVVVFIVILAKLAGRVYIQIRMIIDLDADEIPLMVFVWWGIFKVDRDRCSIVQCGIFRYVNVRKRFETLLETLALYQLSCRGQFVYLSRRRHHILGRVGEVAAHLENSPRLAINL